MTQIFVTIRPTSPKIIYNIFYLSFTSIRVIFTSIRQIFPDFLPVFTSSWLILSKSRKTFCLSNEIYHEVTTKKDNFYKVKLEIEKKINEFVSCGIEWLPINKISLNKEKTSSVISFLEKLEDDDDVQHVYANLEINSDFVNKIATW